MDAGISFEVSALVIDIALEEDALKSDCVMLFYSKIGTSSWTFLIIYYSLVADLLSYSVSDYSIL